MVVDVYFVLAHCYFSMLLGDVFKDNPSTYRTNIAAPYKNRTESFKMVVSWYDVA